ncbi:hypothetical protein CRG98_035215, partial [Punica granatum]
MMPMHGDDATKPCMLPGARSATPHRARGPHVLVSCRAHEPGGTQNQVRPCSNDKYMYDGAPVTLLSSKQPLAASPRSKSQASDTYAPIHTYETTSPGAAARREEGLMECYSLAVSGRKYRGVGEMSPKARKRGGKKWSPIPLCGRDGGGAAESSAGCYEEVTEHLSRDEGSQYSLTGGVLPSLGGNTNRRHKQLRRWIISPFDYRYRIWEGYLVILVYYTAWVSPFEFGFLEKPQGPLAITDNIVNGFFAIDIILTFFVAYMDKSTYLLVDDPKKVAWRYARTWLVFDIISTIPFEVVRSILPSALQQYGIFNMLRLWRLRRVSGMFARLEKDKDFNYFWVRCAKLVS